MNEGYLAVEKLIEYLKEKEGITITKRTLRYYALNGIFPHPAKIGGNRAFYSLSDVPKLKTVIFLKKSGKTIKEIKDGLGSGVHITQEGLDSLQKGLIDRLRELLVNEIERILATGTKLYKNRISLLDRATKNIEQYESKVGSHTAYLSFVMKLSALLNRYPHILPQSWGIKEVNSLLGVTFAPTRGMGLDYIRKKPSIKYHKDEGYYVASDKLETLKHKTKTKVKELVNKRIEELQKLLVYLQNIK